MASAIPSHRNIRDITLEGTDTSARQSQQASSGYAHHRITVIVDFGNGIPPCDSAAVDAVVAHAVTVIADDAEIDSRTAEHIQPVAREVPCRAAAVNSLDIHDCRGGRGSGRERVMRTGGTRRDYRRAADLIHGSIGGIFKRLLRQLQLHRSAVRRAIYRRAPVGTWSQLKPATVGHAIALHHDSEPASIGPRIREHRRKGERGGGSAPRSCHPARP